MKILALILLTGVAHGAAFPSKRSAKNERTQCRKVPQQKLKQECNLEDLVVKTANVVEQCKDVYATHCKQTYAPVARVPFRTSRIVGSTSLVINSEGSHYSKREDVHHGVSTSRTCKKVKEKQCYNVPEEQVVKTQVCKNVAETIYIEECEQIVEDPVVEQVEVVEVVKVKESPVTEKVEKLKAVELQITPAVVQVLIPGNNNGAQTVKESKPATVAPKVKKQKLKPKAKPTKKEPITHNFTTARTVPRASRKIAEDAAYAEIQSQVTDAKNTIIDVRKAVANNEIDFTDAKVKIQGVIQLLDALAEKSKDLEQG